MAEKMLYLKETSVEELTEQWGFRPTYNMFEKLYIRCNYRGDVNWEKAPVYHSGELVNRKIRILG
jgi:hypothetical protein